MIFEWDRNKAESNYSKHEVKFEEVETIFDDFLSITIDSPLHSILEMRFITIGLSIQNRLLVVSHTDSFSGIRIISDRLATKKEKILYEN